MGKQKTMSKIVNTIKKIGVFIVALGLAADAFTTHLKEQNVILGDKQPDTTEPVKE